MPCSDGPSASPIRRGILCLWGWVPVIVCLVLAYLLWRVFHPGLLSYDSIEQYKEAVARQFTDGHPAVMSIALSLVLAMGKGIQHLMLLQCLGGMLGVFCLSYELLRFAFGSRFSASRAHWGALAVLLVLLLPWSPLPFYLMTFWKDVWVLISLCWLGAVSLSLFRLASPCCTAGFLVRLTAYLALVALMTLSRHNALVLMPVCCLLCTMFFWPRVSRRLALGALLLPIVTYGVSRQAMYAVFDIQHRDITRLTYGFELMGLCIQCPEARALLPYTASCMPPHAATNYYPGWVDRSIGVVTTDYGKNPAAIRREYWIALRHYPRQLLRLKLTGFAFHLARNPCLQFQHNANEPNQFGLDLNRRYAKWQDRLRRSLHRSFDDPVLQWVFTRHVVWLVLNAVAVGVLAGLAWTKRSLAALEATVLLLLPLAYYLSYCVFSLAGDFRYMYPATLVMQLSLLALLVGAGSHTLQALKRRGPNVPAHQQGA
jgi:hypothetical protein